MKHFRAQFCLLKWWPEQPNFVFGNQNLNLVASVTTSIIEVGDRKFWIIFHQREENIKLSISKLAYRRGYWTWRLWLNHWKNICFYSFILYLWPPFFFHFGHWNMSLATIFLKLVATKIKIPLWGLSFASLLNIHGGDIHVVPTHLVLTLFYDDIYISFSVRSTVRKY